MKYWILSYTLSTLLLVVRGFIVNRILPSVPRGSLLATRRSHFNKYANNSGSVIWASLIPPQVLPPKPIISCTIPTTSGTTVPAVEDTIGNVTPSTTRRTANQRNRISCPDKQLSSASNAINVPLSSVDPRDPFSFGFVHVGFIRRPHGVHGEVKIDLTTDDSSFRFRSGAELYVKRPHRRSPRPIRIAGSKTLPGRKLLVAFHGFKSRNQALIVSGCQVYARVSDRSTLLTGEYLLRDLVGCLCILSNSNDDPKLDCEDKHVSPVSVATKANKVTYEDSTSSIEPNVVPESIIGVVSGVVPPHELCSTDSIAVQHMHALLEIRLYKRPISRAFHSDTDLKSFLQQTDFDGTEEYCLVPFVPAIVTCIDDKKSIMTINPPMGLLQLIYRKPVPKVRIRGYLPAKIIRLTENDRILINYRCKFM